MGEEGSGFELRGDLGEQLICEAKGYAHDPSEGALGYEDLQWVAAHALYRSPDAALSAELFAWTTDFSAFAAGLRRALDQRGGEATFETLEGQLWFTVALDPLGRAQVDGELRQHPGQGTWIHFQFEAASSDVERLLLQTQGTCRRFPVRRPGGRGAR
jgi:hypothetical protein